METTLPADVVDRPLPLTRAQKKTIGAATLGTIVEFADWVIYATFASVFSALSRQQ